MLAGARRRAGNKLIAAGNSRLKKAADSSVDPAVPAELQKRAATAAAKQGSVDGQEPSVFARGRVLSADDITGTPEEQLAYVTERLHEIDLAGKRAKDFIILNKAVLLEVAQERELHLVAGHTIFSVWAAGVLGVEPKYLFELLQDAARIRAISELGPDLAQHLTRACAQGDGGRDHQSGPGGRSGSHDRGPGSGRGAGQEATDCRAARLDRKGPDRAFDLCSGTEVRNFCPPTVPSVPAAITVLERATTSLKERVYSPLAPSAVQAALEADAAATREYLERLETEIQRVVKRLAAANRAVAAASEQTGAAAS
ncbi:hypothetical protein [Streptomyces sannanensis]|uniref:hypothetical protein n=1 Tax=Streptomyces sannanensis TaxID=285536 RepID=UPI0031EA4544